MSSFYRPGNRLREDEELAQGHIVGQQQSQDLNPGIPNSKAPMH